jgi:hypothetical protein
VRVADPMVNVAVDAVHIAFVELSEGEWIARCSGNELMFVRFNYEYTLLLSFQLAATVTGVCHRL